MKREEMEKGPDGAPVEKKETWAEREKMDSEYFSLMAELGQGGSEASKSAAKPGGKSIVPRGGASASLTLAIESSGGGGQSSPSNNSDYSNSPKPSGDSSSMSMAANGVVESEVNGKKIIDFTQITRSQQPSSSGSIKPMSFQPPTFLQTAARAKPEEDGTANMASAAMMYSQQM